MPDTILLGTDGTEHADRATGHAIAVAAREGAELHAVFVVDTRETGEPALSSTELLIDEYEDRGWEVLKAIETVAAKYGVPVETTCCHGDPTEEIRRLADKIGADMIIVGERGDKHKKLPGEVTRKLERDDERVVVTR